MRTFFAVDLSDEIRSAYRQLYERGRRYPGLRWVPPENLHITLRFLGEMDPERESLLAVEVEAALVDSTPFTMTVGKPGSFGPRAAPRVLWFGVEGGALELERLAGPDRRPKPTSRASGRLAEVRTRL